MCAHTLKDEEKKDAKKDTKTGYSFSKKKEGENSVQKKA